LRSHLIRYQHLPHPGLVKRRVLFITNMWPDEERPYYGSFIASQARSLAVESVAVDVLYVRGYAGIQAYMAALLRVPMVAGRTHHDIVHVHYGHTAVASLGVTQRPLVVSFCGEDLLGAPREQGITLKSQVEVAVFRQVARLATVTITKSEEMAQQLPNGVRARNFVLPNGVDLDMFIPRPRETAREELGWSSADKVILFLGNPDDPRKNVDLAYAASEIVGRSVPDARLEIAWKVPPDRVPILMSAADSLVFPSKSEGSPNAVKEAMACELPIVATAVGDIPQRLADVDNCYVRPPTPGSFADALIQALRAGRAPQARAAVERLSVGAIANRLLEIYDASVDLHARRRWIRRVR
jgi:teichuronic acid biosynthesis glycosyltransferase TuaC